MIIVRTPYRMSFFGGGTDLPVWFAEHGGAFLSTSINHYSWLTCRYLPPFFDHKHRVVWSKLERPHGIDDIEHPAVRAALQTMGFGDKGLDISVLSDLPARAGLGSSSSFVVGLLHALHLMQGHTPSHRQLADEAIHLERVVMQEAGGIQDQIAAAFGGLNHVTIKPDGGYDVTPVKLPEARLKEFESHLMLFFSGLSRSAYTVETAKVKALSHAGKQTQDMAEMAKLVDVALNVLRTGSMHDFGRLLHDTWVLKRGLTAGVSTDLIDNMYARARGAGALGGKLLGAGGGGFFLVFAEPEKHAAIRAALCDMIHVPVTTEHEGSTVIIQEQKEYDDESYRRRDIIHAQPQQEKAA